jgi:hypothetical protein
MPRRHDTKKVGFNLCAGMKLCGKEGRRWIDGRMVVGVVACKIVYWKGFIEDA